MRLTTTIITAVLLAGCIGLLQYHSIQFWMVNVDPATGWAWSLLLEGAALWLWTDRRLPRRLLGAVATLLLLCGPLYQVSAPLVQEWQATDRGAVANLERRAALTEEIASLEAALNTYLANSTRRQGWAERIDRTQQRLDAARTELGTLIAANGQAPRHMSWQRAAIIVLQALALVLLQGVGVLAIGELRRAAQLGTQPAPVTAPRPAREGTARPSLAVVTPRRRATTA